jgi:hypothetical protein
MQELFLFIFHLHGDKLRRSIAPNMFGLR